uniref:Cytochrome c oxidase subunit 3 n=1 Tax=Clydonella sawyeri TaxID=2201168 RepID=A0A2U9DQQ9_9EUKA|nr:cytochrome oxidase subunit 3 [Clydonella sawyeri]
MGGHQQHAFHIVNPSPWPLITSLGTLSLTMGAVGYFHHFALGKLTNTLGFILVVVSAFIWWRDVCREGNYEGHHTSVVQAGLKLGMLLFIVSEIMFFASFFWAFFHSSLAPTIEIGAVWPPRGILVLDPWAVPFLNTIILLFSGASITWSHHALILSFRDQAAYAFKITLLFAVLFTLLQLAEYVEAGFNISDGVYGSTFLYGYWFSRFSCYYRYYFYFCFFFAFCRLSIYF